MGIKIGTVSSIGDPEQFEIIPDDRQTVIQLDNGVHVQDHGYFEEGQVIQLQAEFENADWAIVKGYWVSRTLVTVIDHRGRIYFNHRVVVKRYSDASGMSHTKATIELWGK